MKKILFIALLGVVLFGCKKDDDDNGGSSSAPFSVTIDGTKWTPVTSTGVSMLGVVTITAVDTKTSVSVVLGNSAKGEYVIGTVGGTAEVSYTKTDVNQSFYGSSGKVTVTSHDTGKKKISGSFDVVVTGVTGTSATHTLKGTFSVTYSSFGLKK
jgi:hypothetical protein